MNHLRLNAPVRCVPSALHSSARPGFTLIEMLISLAVTLIMMGAVVTLFGTMTNSIAGSRSLIETTDRLRALRNRLQLDLQGATARMTPPLRPEEDLGYFEVTEGTLNDSNNGFTGNGATLFGDVDDVLAFTVKSAGDPFIGVDGGGASVQSQTAEVLYFLMPSGPIMDVNNSQPTTWITPSPTAPTRLYTLYRAIWLVMPGAPSSVTLGGDMSVRGPVGTANSLGDLTKPENRNSYKTAAFASLRSGFPCTIGQLRLNGYASNPASSAAVIMNNVLSFDVQVWDSGAPVRLDSSSSIALEPHDPGWASATTNLSFGAWVDLGYSYTKSGSDPTPLFASSIGPLAKSGITAFPYRYDTWSLHFENNGVDEDGDGKTDAGTNGIDDDASGAPGFGIVDDINEYDTRPPFPAQLRGVKITVRVYEPTSKQVRQITVVQDFLPE